MKAALTLVFALFAAFGCSKQEAGAQAQKAPKVGEYVNPASVWSWLQEGSAFCYGIDSAGSCEAIEYPTGIGKDEGLISQVRLNSDGGMKLNSIQKLRRKDAELCTTATEQFVDSFQFYDTVDTKAWITPDDKLVQGRKVQDFLETIKKASRQSFGVERYFRFIVTKVSGDGLVAEVQEHLYIAGVRQTRPRDSLITGFSQEHAKTKLLLRPGDA